MGFHGALGHEQRLRDLPVGLAHGGKLRDPQLARGERIDSADGVSARPAAGGDEFLAGTLGDGQAAERTGQVQALAQELAGGVAGAGPAAGGAEIEQRAGQLQPGRRRPQHADRLGEQGSAVIAAGDQAGGAQCHPQGPPVAPAAGEIHLFPGQLRGGLPIAEGGQRQRRVGAPRQHRRVADTPPD